MIEENSTENKMREVLYDAFLETQKNLLDSKKKLMTALERKKESGE